uniref:Transposable element P transposase-like GTP-binding insertion domain-containing protein n=1 Tax=Lepeophtheirus salmonis TaxID=72036 RepID=A0A0K2TCC0_LEPSM
MNIGIVLKKCNIINTFPSPLSSHKLICFIADIPHLIKSLRNHLMRGHAITILAHFVKNYNIFSKGVDMEAFLSLIAYQDKVSYKLHPKLSKKSIKYGQFQRIKVNLASHLLSQQTAAAIRVFVSTGCKIINILRQFYDQVALLDHKTMICFDLTTSRRPAVTLSMRLMSKYKWISFIPSEIFLRIYTLMTIMDGSQSKAA